MTDKEDESRGELLPAGPDDQVVSDRVQELAWALLDEQINDDEFRLLENLLLSGGNARGSYLKCVQMHSDLMSHFATISEKQAAGPKAPVLGFLSEPLPPIGTPSTKGLN